MMKTRRIVAAVAAMVVSFMVAGPAFAADGSWSLTRRHYSVYTPNDTVDPTSTYFTAPAYVDSLDVATSVAAQITRYQGDHVEWGRVCYSQPYGNQPVACTPWYNLVNPVSGLEAIGQFRVVDANQNATGGAYNVIYAKGSFQIQHRFPNGLPGPIYSDPGYDSLVVTYTEG
ncbi:branched-chain amino acid ABC transporter substrate-binding protein [Mobiluncus sp.]|uniref:branched-chain amino acid ABC transporter substrate-binding protein n=1 Tax=Mobiluncus sp. TaxID=47293 RepID=UPI002A914449|nr:branched-chain amino acid ABC transporter substrate-binding protein [Mobiluncus sp.]MDY6077483.1 branched-chain amino acid ABC transporter substrate-binding protein [Mobiluncus sp.]